MQQQFEFIPVEHLLLDLNNPRLPKSKQGKNEQTVIEFLLLEAATQELMESIGENDFFAGEMLLVVPSPEQAGKYVVIEGNRRLAAVMLLRKPDLATVKKATVREIASSATHFPEELPCLVFQRREEIQKFLGFVHITGKKSWRMLEKARYLYDLRKSETFKDLSFLEAGKEIARIIGSRSPYVRKMLISYSLYEIVEDEMFYQIDGLSDTTFFLNYFSDSLQKDNIRKYMGVDPDSDEPLSKLNHEHLQELVTWWFKKNEGVSRVLGDSEGMKWLNAVIGDSAALEAFKKGATIQSAYEMTAEIGLQFEKKVKDALECLDQADRLSNRMETFYSDLSSDLKRLRQIAMKINDFRARKEQGDDEF